MNCNNCGSELRTDATFCTNCGTKIEQEQQQPAEPAPELIEPAPEPIESAPAEPVQYKQDEPEPAEPAPEPIEPAPVEPVQYKQDEPVPAQPKPDLPPVTPAPFVQQQPQIQQQPVQFNQQQQPGQFGQPQPGQFGQQQFQYQQQMTGIPPVPKKKSNTGLIVGLSIGGFILLVIVFFAGLFTGIGIGAGLALIEEERLYHYDYNPITTPMPTPQINVVPPVTTPPPTASADNNLIARWERESGDYLWFFHLYSVVEFSLDQDGLLEIVLDEGTDWGRGYTESNGNLFIEASWGSEYEFTYSIERGNLIIIDSDGDTAIFTIAG